MNTNLIGEAQGRICLGTVNMSAECIRDLAIAFSIVAIAVSPARIAVAVPPVLI